MTIVVTLTNPTSGLVLPSDRPNTINATHTFTGNPTGGACLWQWFNQSGGGVTTVVTGPNPLYTVPANTWTPGTWKIRRNVQQDMPYDEGASGDITFTTAPTPLQSTVTSPANGTVTTATTVVVNWTTPTAEQDAYRVQVADAANPAIIRWTSGDVEDPGTIRTHVASLPVYGDCVIRVSRRVNGVWSDPSTGVQITRNPVAPTITAPIVNAQFVVNAQTLTWTVTDQEGYEARILDSLGAVEWTSGEVTSVTRTLGLSFPVEGTKTIDLRVRSGGVWSSRTTRAVSRIAPPTPVITSPTAGQAFATVDQTITWTSSRQERYELRILHAATGVVEWTSGELPSMMLSRYLSIPNLGTKTIDLRVRDESVWSPRTTVTVTVSPTPVLTTLTGGVVAASNETLVGGHTTPFEGDDYQAAVKSRYRIIGAGTWTEGASQSGSQEFYTYPNLVVGNYERQVAVSLNATGEFSPWSASGNFTVFARPPMPSITLPIPNSSVADKVNVEWIAPSQDAYEIQVRNGNVVEWTSGVVVANATRIAEVQFPTLGSRQIFLRVRNNTLWSNDGPDRTWTIVPVSVVATPVTSLDRVIDPFVASSMGYDSVTLSWTPPLDTSWDGYRIVRSRSGYPTTENDGVVAVEVLGGTWASQTGYVNEPLAGGWHYYTFFLRTMGTGLWVRVATTDVLVPYDFETTDKLWDTIPEYYKNIRDDTADFSAKNIRINPELYLSNDYTSPNPLLSAFLHLFGIGLDHVRTQVEYVVGGYDSNATHVSRLSLLAQQFGRDLEQSVPAHANRTVVRNLAYLYRKRGTLDGIAELATMTTGWDVETNLGPNMMLNEDQAAFANPQYDKWDAARYYTAGMQVRYGSYIYQNILASSGLAQAPANSGVNNSWWNVVLAVADRTLARIDTGDVSTWQYNLSPGGVLSGKTAIAVGVVDPLDALTFQSNALVIERTDANGATDVTAMSIPSVAAAGQTLVGKQQVLEAGIPLPQAVAHVVDQEYQAGSLVLYNTIIYEAKVDTATLPTDTANWKQVSNANVAPRQRLSVYAHGPFTGTGGTGGRAVTLVVHQYDAEGVFISEVTGVDAATNSGAVGAAWTRPYYTFTPANNARYLAVGARVASPGLNEKQHLTKWMIERPEISVTTPSAYSKAREAQVTVKADRVNLVTNPSFEVDTTGWTESNSALSVNAAWGFKGTKSLAITPNNAGSSDSYAYVNVLVSPNKTYYVEATVRLTAAQTGTLDSRARKLVVYAYLGASVVGTAITTAAAPNAAGTTTLSGLYTVPATGVDRIQIRAYNGAITGGGVVNWDAVMAVEAAAPVPYFDGSTSTNAVWEGTAHASRSHYYENRLERVPALTRALQDTVPIGIGVGTPKFGPVLV